VLQKAGHCSNDFFHGAKEDLVNHGTLQLAPNAFNEVPLPSYTASTGGTIRRQKPQSQGIPMFFEKRLNPFGMVDTRIIQHYPQLFARIVGDHGVEEAQKLDGRVLLFMFAIPFARFIVQDA